MTDRDTQRIVIARSLMWEAVGIGVKAQWLAEADRAITSLESAARRPAAPSGTEGGGPPRLSVVQA